ncbi:phage integrase N-terminal SAM-like domain-containing protein [Roseateles sp. GG27B]
MSTEDAYVHWCKAFILFHDKQHPKDLGGAEVESFLTWLANERGVAPATHKQALSALLFLYTKVLGMNLPWMQEIGRPRVKRRLPVVLSRATRYKAAAVLRHLDGVQLPFAQQLTERACG